MDQAIDQVIAHMLTTDPWTASALDARLRNECEEASVYPRIVLAALRIRLGAAGHDGRDVFTLLASIGRDAARSLFTEVRP